MSNKENTEENEITISYMDLEYEEHPALQTLSCPICTCPAMPIVVRLPCGHIFCKAHILEWLKTNATCPMCKTEFEKKDIIEDKIIEDIINTLKVSCPQKELGCNWLGERGKLIDHLKNSCQYMTYKCIYPKCNYVGLTKDKEEHEKICEWKPYVCNLKGCNFKGYLGDKEHHENVCELKLVACPNYLNGNGCQMDKIMRKDFQDHLWKCEFFVKDLPWIIKKSDEIQVRQKNDFTYFEDQTKKSYERLKKLEDIVKAIEDDLESDVSTSKDSLMAIFMDFHWNPNDKNSSLKLSSNNLIVKYKKHCSPGCSWSSVRSSVPIPTYIPAFYYEIKILNFDEDWRYSNSIGISTKQAPLNQNIPPSSKKMWCYFNNGSININGKTKNYGENVNINDVIGCCVIFKSRTLFFTKNGQPLGIASKRLPIDIPLYPTVGMYNNSVIETNFGQKDFVFDFLSFISDLENNEKELNVMLKKGTESGDEYEYDSFSDDDNEYSEDEYSNRNTEDSFSESSFSLSDNSSDDESMMTDPDNNPSSLSVINSDITRLFSVLFN